MKIDRLIGILAILLQQEKVTAPFLAEKFEVSRRTINRDIEDICRAGIPIVTAQGQNGGISIMEGYRMDHTLLTSADMRSILAGLRSLDSVSGTNKYQQLMAKLSVGNSDILTSNNHIMIDLASWYKEALASKIELIQGAIESKEKIKFTYHSQKGEAQRKIEPGLLIFQWSSWYVWGYCCKRKDFRLFKLNRMVDLEAVEEKCKERQIPMPDLSLRRVYPVSIQVKVLFEKQVKWRLVDAFGENSFTEQADGRLLFSHGFTDKENLFEWILGFGDCVELIEPKELRKELYNITSKINTIYKT